jgi:hypothetical protein
MKAQPTDTSIIFDIPTLIMILQIMVELKIHDDEAGGHAGNLDAKKIKQDLQEVIEYLAELKSERDEMLVGILPQITTIHDAIEFLNALKSETDHQIKEILQFMTSSITYHPIVMAFVQRYSYLLPQKKPGTKNAKKGIEN